MSLPIHFSRNIHTCHVCPFRPPACQGWCPCRVDGRQIIDHARDHDCPLERFTPRRLGDTLAWIIQRTGIARLLRDRPNASASAPSRGKNPAYSNCGCAARRHLLNRIAPYETPRS